MTDELSPPLNVLYRAYPLVWYEREEAIAAYVKRYGMQPTNVYEHSRAWWLGPVPEGMTK